MRSDKEFNSQIFKKSIEHFIELGQHINTIDEFLLSEHIKPENKKLLLKLKITLISLEKTLCSIIYEGKDSEFAIEILKKTNELLNVHTNFKYFDICSPPNVIPSKARDLQMVVQSQTQEIPHCVRDDVGGMRAVTYLDNNDQRNATIAEYRNLTKKAGEASARFKEAGSYMAIAGGSWLLTVLVSAALGSIVLAPIAGPLTIAVLASISLVGVALLVYGYSKQSIQKEMNAVKSAIEQSFPLASEQSMFKASKAQMPQSVENENLSRLLLQLGF